MALSRCPFEEHFRQYMGAEQCHWGFDRLQDLIEE
jgi:hypothetical protein